MQLMQIHPQHTGQGVRALTLYIVGVMGEFTNLVWSHGACRLQGLVFFVEKTKGTGFQLTENAIIPLGKHESLVIGAHRAEIFHFQSVENQFSCKKPSLAG
jgi:hypothetical protein